MSASLKQRLVLAVIVAVLYACASPPQQYERPLTSQVAILETTLRSLNLESPIVDLDANLKHGDFRVIGVYGYACVPPGVAEADYGILANLGVRCLDGTSDVIENNEHGALIQKAIAYATVYNSELVRRVREGKVFPNPALKFAPSGRWDAPAAHPSAPR